VGFLGLAALRSMGLIPHQTLGPAATATSLLTIVSMAVLGLDVNVRVVAGAGVCVIGTVTVSLLLLAGISLALIHALSIA
jgi:uncharacterized membrane protein YadS